MARSNLVTVHWRAPPKDDSGVSEGPGQSRRVAGRKGRHAGHVGIHFGRASALKGSLDACSKVWRLGRPCASLAAARGIICRAPRWRHASVQPCCDFPECARVLTLWRLGLGSPTLALTKRMRIFWRRSRRDLTVRNRRSAIAVSGVGQRPFRHRIRSALGLPSHCEALVAWRRSWAQQP